jgi:ADP-heptose:LPS heptosyltransferase
MHILALRSYGDYVILLNSIKHAGLKENITIVVSNHLKPLHEALNPNFSKNFEFIFKDFGIKNGLLGFFTNRYFFRFNTLFEILKLSFFIKSLRINEEKIFLEHSARKILLNLFLGKKLHHLYKKGNVYEVLGRFFGLESNHKTFQLSKFHSKNKVLIFPDSRKKHKVINEAIMEQLSSDLTRLKVDFKIAKFGALKNENSQSTSQIAYSDFKALVLLIRDCDFVISSDSVPVHIAEFLEKQHMVIYNDKVNYNWLTPFAKIHHMYTTFKETPIFINKYFN